MKKKITKTIRTYTVYDINNEVVGKWDSPTKLLSDLHISCGTLLYKSINNNCYISNNIKEKTQYRIEFVKEKVTTTVEVEVEYKPCKKSYYIKKENPYNREYMIELPDDAKPVDYVPEISGLYACPDGRLFGIDEHGIYTINTYLNKCNSKHNCNKYGYYRFHYQKKMFRVHNVLARLFVPGYEDGLVVDHINGISTDNRLENLQWLTLSDNAKKYHNEDATYEEKMKHRDAISRAQIKRWADIPVAERHKHSNLPTTRVSSGSSNSYVKLSPEERAAIFKNIGAKLKARWEALPEDEKERRREQGRQGARRYWESLSEGERDVIRGYGALSHKKKNGGI